jgi:5'-nucleotidase
LSKKPFILLTNDDGIAAAGIEALYHELIKIGEVAVVAPRSEMSAAGHAITLSDPLRVSEYRKDSGFSGYAVNGTPADCVKIAYWAVLKKRPDLVASGINLGSNTGINTIYSGTVSAATEGAILDIPSFAVSLGTYENPDFRYAARFGRKLASQLIEKGLPKGVYLNVNVPPCPEGQIRGVSVTRQGQAVYKEEFDRRKDPHGRTYYWLTGQKINPEKEIEVDDGALARRMVSITPLHFDLTQYAFLEELRSWDLKP